MRESCSSHSVLIFGTEMSIEEGCGFCKRGLVGSGLHLEPPEKLNNSSDVKGLWVRRLTC